MMKQHMRKGYTPNNGASFYVIRTYHERKTLQKVQGYTFEKFGNLYGVTRNENSKCKYDAWFIYDIETGLPCAISESSGKAAQEKITAELVQDFENTRERDKAVFHAMYEMRMQCAELLAREQRRTDTDGFMVSEADAEMFCEQAADLVKNPGQSTLENHSEPKENRPQKDFAGTEISGNGWRILFDTETERTRIIFSGTVKSEAIELMEKEKFFFSGKMKSYNKRLTMKAYRAAQRVAAELEKIYAA